MASLHREVGIIVSLDSAAVGVQQWHSSQYGVA